ncbi:RNA polymerase sigma factor [Streptomyces virginiae]|uniref:RNA polymerase sigma factor n=1 Tax=Streptomyces virginiae TaxID=1961 RepID=UPI002258B803|nr:sigma-70 family RNA polymerase sigma factor [Streptomyces virginiae]MCX5278163.1 sigma-70 family RNA polymerase sigma factor [Streptomyces virginiae]
MQLEADGFSDFFLHWEPQVRRYLIWLEGDRAVIDDAAQETMISAYRYWEKVKDLEKPSAWLFKVAGQRLSDAQEARGRAGVSTDPQDFPDTASPGGADEYALRDDRLAILDAVRKLPPQQAAAIALQIQHDLPLDEIADIMSVSTGSVKTHLHHARKALKSLLVADGGAR